MNLQNNTTEEIPLLYHVAQDTLGEKRLSITYQEVMKSQSELWMSVDSCC